jgi:flagella basal body P-ring formation protein FlgA
MVNFKSIIKKWRINTFSCIRGRTVSLSSVIASILLVSASMNALAESYHPHSDIYRQVKSFLLTQNQGDAEHTEIKIGRIDPRLKLQQCTTPLEIFLPQNSRTTGRTIVGVKCHSPKKWTIYVQADIIKSIKVFVSTGPISRGEKIDETSVELKLMESDQLRFGYITDKNDIIGMVASRRISADTVITPRMLTKPKLVKRGEKVQIIAEVDGVVIRVEGEALEDGAKGDIIRVRNTSSRKIIEAEVIAPGKVKVRV